MIKFMLYILCVSCVFITSVFCQVNYTSLVVSKPTRTFEIDYETNQFLLDGKPFRYISGSVHYFRMPAIYWEDRLRKLRAAGLNAVETYVEWSQHEPYPGVYDFTGDNDLIQFIRLAEKYELLVILRPGPYICAERDLGGYPAWLFTLHPTIKLRTSDPNHKHYVKRWFDILLTNIQPLLYGNGGPIIMVQVENEYGSFYACDSAYTVWLRDLVKSYVHNNAVLFTTDGAGDNFMKCGPIPNVFITVDFGPMPTKEGVHKAFEVIRRAGQLRGPLVNSEYYTGWLTHWNENSQMVSTERVLKTLKDILDHGNNTSVNMYMFFGGSSFGFTSGANCDDSSGFRAQLTSYDYDAPISEDGDLTNKYYAIRQFLSQYVPIPPIIINNLSKANYGDVDLVPKISLFKLMNTLPVVKHIYPVTFEELSYYSGYVMYKHKINSDSILADPSQLYVPGLRDRAIVYIDQVAVGILSRFRNIFSIPLKLLPGQTIYLLVENEGHINYGTFINDTKGIVCQVLLNGDPLLNWEMTQVPMKNISKIESMPDSQTAFNAPGYFSSYFQLPNDGKYAVDSYLNMDGWGKGVAFLNGINLGRYWVTTGPQLTLYVPKNMFKDYPEYNNLTIFEQEIVNPSYTASFQAEPILDLRPPNLGKYGTKCQTKCRPFPKH